MGIRLILAATILCVSSGVPAALGSRYSAFGQRVAVLLLAGGSLLGICGIGWFLMGLDTAPAEIAWSLPLGQFKVSVDAISVVFLAPVWIVPVFGSIYGLAYWKQSEHPENGRKLCLFYGFLTGSMAMVVIAQNAILFLIAWEVMAVSAFFLATTQDDDPEVRKAGWVYLIATHVGTLCLLAMFALMRRASGSFDLDAIATLGISPTEAKGIFLLALVGFGFKAGLMPFHVWLPGAHSNAPSHVSAVMSGVMLKMGVYGIVRLTSLLHAPPPWWGGTLLALGAATGVLGIAFAIGQRDLKRLLAYSSIENIGIISMGIGLALLGRSLDRADWIVLGLGGALLHVWNHSLFKSLLFMNAGAIIHASHTREINRIGGLGKQMPQTAGLFFLGSMAICALPPLNGFVGEWLIYLGLFKTIDPASGISFPAASIGVAALAVIGALATACFVNLFGAIFMGEPRNKSVLSAQDPGRCCTYPMAFLALGCVVLGVMPQVAISVLNQAIQVWAEPSPASLPVLQKVAPFGWITGMAVCLMVLVGTTAIALRRVLRGRVVARAGTWDCGFSLPTPRMQYTHSSFGEMLVDLFGWALLPKKSRTRVKGLFAGSEFFERQTPDTVLDHLVLPTFRFAEHWLTWLRRLQQGRTEVYLSYILFIVLVLLFWGAIGS